MNVQQFKFCLGSSYLTSGTPLQFNYAVSQNPYLLAHVFKATSTTHSATNCFFGLHLNLVMHMNFHQGCAVSYVILSLVPVGPMLFHGGYNLDKELKSDESGCLLQLAMLFLIVYIDPSSLHDFPNIKLSNQLLKAFLSSFDVQVIVNCYFTPLSEVVPSS